MAEAKTKPTKASVNAFIAAVSNPTRRADARTVLKLMRRVSGVAPRMWGPSIVGFGLSHYRYESGREGDMPRIGFSPRKAQLVLYVLTGAGDRDLLARLGKHKTGVSCLYINRLADVDMTVLEALIVRAWEASAQHGGC